MHLFALRPRVGLLIFASFLSITGEAAAQSQEKPVPRLTPRLRPRAAPPASAPESPSPAPSRDAAEAPREEAAPKKERSPQSIAPTSSSPDVRVAPQPILPEISAGAPPALVPYRKLPPPAGYVEKKSFNAALLGGGGLVLGITYGASIAFAGTQNFENGLGSVFVPILGPWIAIGQRDFTCEVDTSTTIDGIEGSTAETQKCVARQTQTAAFLVGLGVGQLVGASLLTVGLLDRRRSWVRADLAGVEMDIDVLATPHYSGLLARGRF